MKRSLKNIIMIIILMLSVSGMVFTMNVAKNNLKVDSSNVQKNNGMPTPPNGDMTPPDMNNNENSDSTDSASENKMTPKEKPDGDSNTNTPPEKPGENNNSSTSDSTDENKNTPPDMNSSDNTNTPPEMPNNSDMNKDNSTTTVKTASLTTPYYIAFWALALLSSIIIVYLLMSKFNKKTFKETFSSSDKTIIFVLCMAIFTVGITYLDTYITTNYFLTSSSKNNNSNNNGPTSNTSVAYSAQKEITSDEDISSGKYSSTTKDENAILVNGNVKSTISDVTVNKTGDSDGGDNTSFYGTNSAITAKSGANLTLKNITVKTDATGANGVFSYGGSATTSNSSSDGTTVTISDSKITTTKDNSGGIMTTGGGVMKATNLEINTSGTSSAAIRSDRGGGTVTVDKGTYKTTGQGSPTIYSTADITVSNAELIATASEGVVIEGANSVTLNSCKLTDTNNKLNGQSTTYKNIFLYQSMSGDASNGTAEFTSKDSTIITNKGDTLYVTNTNAKITLENNKITNKDSDGNFLRVQKDSWGNSGSNGGDVTLVLKNQVVEGNVVVDSISTLAMSMESKSYYEGTINSDNSAKSISLKLDKNSKIKLTGDSYVTSLEDADSSYSNIDFNGYKLYVNGKAIN